MSWSEQTGQHGAMTSFLQAISEPKWSGQKSNQGQSLLRDQCSTYWAALTCDASSIINCNENFLDVYRRLSNRINFCSRLWAANNIVALRNQLGIVANVIFLNFLLRTVIFCLFKLLINEFTLKVFAALFWICCPCVGCMSHVWSVCCTNVPMCVHLWSYRCTWLLLSLKK